MSNKAQFYDEMNEHPNADYRSIGPYVVEFERMPRDRASIAIWRRVEDDEYGPREPPKGGFAKVVRGFGDRDRMRSLFERIGDRTEIADAKRLLSS